MPAARRRSALYVFTFLSWVAVLAIAEIALAKPRLTPGETISLDLSLTVAATLSACSVLVTVLCPLVRVWEAGFRAGQAAESEELVGPPKLRLVSD